MLTKQLVSTEIPALLFSDKIKDAIPIFNRHKISHLPVISKDMDYLGMIEDISIKEDDKQKNISEIPLLKAEETQVHDYQHYYSIFDVIYAHKLSVVAVVDKENKYLGNISQQVLFESIANILSLQSYGGIIVLELNYRDYSLNQIAQIIESNGAKVLNVCTKTIEQDTLEVTIKINTSEITSIIETFLRYDYSVKSFFGEYNKLEELYRSRIEELNKYLNI